VGGREEGKMGGKEEGFVHLTVFLGQRPKMVAWLSGQLKRIAHKWPSPQTRRNFIRHSTFVFLGTIVSVQ